MNSGSRRPTDDTGESAVGDLAGDSLLAEILGRIDDKTDRILILGSVGLQMSDSYLSSALTIDKTLLTARVTELMRELRKDREMSDKLRDLRRAGRVENYLALAFRLGLEDWFCASDEVLRRLIRPVDESRRSTVLRYSDPRWWDRGTRLRSRAILLLGFTCIAGLTSADLVALDVEDIVRTARGLELRLRRTATRQTRYVTVAVRNDQRICPVDATLAWKRYLADAGHRSGPLFVRLTSVGRPTEPTTRLTGRAVAGMVEHAARLSFDIPHFDRLRTSESVGSFLVQRVSAR